MTERNYRGIDQYSERAKKAIATPDQLKKAKAILAPINVKLDLDLPSREDIEDISKLRELLAKTSENLARMTTEARRREVARASMVGKLEAINPRFRCPKNNKSITLVDCQRSCSGSYCSNYGGYLCGIRRQTIKEFFKL